MITYRSLFIGLARIDNLVGLLVVIIVLLWNPWQCKVPLPMSCTCSTCVSLRYTYPKTAVLLSHDNLAMVIIVLLWNPKWNNKVKSPLPMSSNSMHMHVLYCVYMHSRYILYANEARLHLVRVWGSIASLSC